MQFSLLSEDLHSLLEAIVESSADAIFSKTLGGLVLSWNSGAERLYGYSAHEMIGQSVLLLMPEDRRQELAAILYRLAEGKRVAPFETVRRRKDGSLVDVSVTISPLRDATGKILGASTIARDITERKQAEGRQRVLNEASNVLVSSLNHQITLQEIAQLLVPAFADYCRIALVVAVPDTILQKPGVLTEEEWALMRSHSAVGAEVVSHIPALPPLAPAIRAHHERWDGQGYPDQLAGEAIPLGARILAVADAYLAMIANRPYRQACVPAVALAELRRCAGSQFDLQVIEVLTRLLRPQEEEAAQYIEGF